MMNRDHPDSLITIGITSPPDFPAKPYNSIHRHCQPKMTPPSSPDGERWSEYGSAWNAAAYRFRAVTEHDEAFGHAITLVDSEGRYLQEKELFGFFMSGLSTLESFSYALHFLASFARLGKFQVKDPWKITMKKTAGCFEQSFPSEPLTLIFRELLESMEYKEWEAIRNILGHRGAPGRSITLSTVGSGIPGDDIWKLCDIPLNKNTTGQRREWLAETLKSLLENAEAFVVHNI